MPKIKLNLIKRVKKPPDIKSNDKSSDPLRDFWLQAINNYHLNSQLFSLFDIDITSFETFTLGQKWYRVRKYATQEFLSRSKLRDIILKLDNFPDLKNIYKDILTKKELKFRPFWDQTTKDFSKKLWLPKTSTPFRKVKTNSWFNIKCANEEVNNSDVLDNVLKSSESLRQPNIKVIRSRKVRLFLNTPQKQIFNRWLGTSRYIYNQAIDYINSDQPRLSGHKLRDKLVSNVSEDLSWQKETPQAIRGAAVLEANQAFETNMKKYKKTRIPFHLKHRSRKAKSQTICFAVDSLNKDFKLYPKLLGKDSAILTYLEEKKHFGFRQKFVNLKTDLLDEEGNKVMKNGKPIRVNTGKQKFQRWILEKEFKIQKMRTGEWYLLIPLEIDVNGSENQGADVTLDPGVRTFLTSYSSKGEVLKIGDGDINKIRNYLLKTDKLKSIIDKMNGKKKHRYRRAFLKRLRNVQNRIKDCHRKTVKFLVERYDLIIIPVFKVKEMTKKDQRRIMSKTVRNMLSWSHYKFRMMLISKVMEYLNKRVLLPSEEYTSKTCTKCGAIKDNLGGGKVYICTDCGLVLDRDINGSRNILLKTCKELSEVVTSTCLTLGPLLGDQ